MQGHVKQLQDELKAEQAKASLAELAAAAEEKVTCLTVLLSRSRNDHILQFVYYSID